MSTLEEVDKNPFLEAVEGDPFAQQKVPQAFLDRLALGERLGRVANAAAVNAKHGFGQSETPTGLSDKTMSELIDLGLFHDPAKGGPGPLQFMTEAMTLPAVQAWQTLMRGIEGGIHGLGGAWGQIIEEFGGSEGMGNRAKNEAINFGNWAMIEAGMGSFVRPTVGRMNADPIGVLPKEIDFKNAATVIDEGKGASAAVEGKLKTLWEERGIHPSEAAVGAREDAFLRHDLGAAKTDLPPDVPLDVQPAQPPGRMATAATEFSNKMLNIGRDIQMLTVPMSAGVDATRAMAKDFANSLRRNAWDWQRIDTDLEKRFTPEQRKRMWDAADEESVARQLGESRQHQGLVTLEPAERAAVDDLHTRAQIAWAKARDLEMVQGEGLPAYTPRMILNVSTAMAGDRALPLNGTGANLRVRTAQMLRRKHLTAEETEAAAKAAYGEQATLVRDIRTLALATAKLEDAVAGRALVEDIKRYGRQAGEDVLTEGAPPVGSEHKWFTIDHPALRTWRPKLSFDKETRSSSVMKDGEGNIIFEQVPLFIRGEFEGPLRAVLTDKSGALYKSIMDLKGKTTSVIMNSPLIHNAVEWGRALPAMPGKVATFKVYFDGNRAKNNLPFMQEAIENGLVPIGKRFFNQDINAIAEMPNLTPGRSWTAQVLSAFPGLFSETAGLAVKRAIDRAGDFWHNTLLWDRIGDLQMGLYSNFLDDLRARGVDHTTASRVAAHFANRFAGALPKEAMSNGAQKFANFILFSRTFTLGNLGVMKDMLTGLPKDVVSQITRDMGQFDPAAAGYAKSLARRKALAVVGADIALFYIGNAILQSAINVLVNDSTLDEEMHGYAQRLQEKLKKVQENPLELLQPFNFFQSLSPTEENEPNRQDRLKVGHDRDGTAIYTRNPAGRIGEEFIGWLTGPFDMIRKKLGTIARPGWQILANDKGFGRKIYDPEADMPAKYLQNLVNIVMHLVGAQTPENQIAAVADLVKGDGDPKVNVAKALGPVLGVNVSKGAPGGEAIGELYSARTHYQYALDAALPDIRKQIQRGDTAGAIDKMMELGVPAGMQHVILRTSENPSTRMSGRSLRDFELYATPEQKRRMERAIILQQPRP